MAGLKSGDSVRPVVDTTGARISSDEHMIEMLVFDMGEFRSTIFLASTQWSGLETTLLSCRLAVHSLQKAPLWTISPFGKIVGLYMVWNKFPI